MGVERVRRLVEEMGVESVMVMKEMQIPCCVVVVVVVKVLITRKWSKL